MSLLYKYSIAIYLCVTLFASCSNVDHSADEKHFVKFNDTDFASVQLAGTAIGDSSNIRDPRRLLCIDKYLVVADPSFGKMIRVFDTTNFALIAETGTYGSGPGNLLGTKDLLKGHNTRDFYAYDLTQKKLIYFNIDSLQKGKRSHLKEISFDQTELANLLSIEVIDDSTFAGTIMNASGRIVYFRDNNVVGYKGEIPSNIHSTSDYVHGHSFRADIAKFNEALVTSCFFSDLIQAYTKEGDSIAAYQGPDGFWPVYYYKNKVSLQTVPETQVAYLGMTANTHSLYNLYKGSNSQNVIYQFDSKLRPVAKIEVANHQVESITCDNDQLFCIVDVETHPKILKLNIQKIKSNLNVAINK